MIMNRELGHQNLETIMHSDGVFCEMNGEIKFAVGCEGNQRLRAGLRQCGSVLAACTFAHHHGLGHRAADSARSVLLEGPDRFR